MCHLNSCTIIARTLPSRIQVAHSPVIPVASFFCHPSTPFLSSQCPDYLDPGKRMMSSQCPDTGIQKSLLVSKQTSI
ncbi:MAG: hypothetical protein KTM48_07840, partial [Wolbachia endosymbiont of Pissodes strobi]|nr:hypothetical protein [Wolbachia endosymbiont of Pissodes strobi]